MFHLTRVYIIFSSVSVAEWPPFGKYLLTRLTNMFSRILNISNIKHVVISHFGFEG